VTLIEQVYLIVVTAS